MNKGKSESIAYTHARTHLKPKGKKHVLFLFINNNHACFLRLFSVSLFSTFFLL